MKILYKITIYLILLISIINATPQESDLIIVQRDTFALYSLPLEKYLEKNNISSKQFEEYGFSTSCYRYYRAIWKIQNDSLFLEDLVSCVSDTVKIPFKLIFNKMGVHKPVFANWVTDTLWAEIGNKIYYLHEGWGYFYDKEKCFNINQGIIKGTNVFDYTDKYFISKLNENIFPLYNIYCNEIDWNKLPITENEIKIIVLLSNDTSYVIKNISNADKSYEDEALRIVRVFKPTKLFQFNKEIKLSFGIPILFSKAIKENCKN